MNIDKLKEENKAIIDEIGQCSISCLDAVECI
jgi:hypothetical protein